MLADLKGLSSYHSLEAQLPTYWVPILKSVYRFILSVTQGPTIWVPIGISGAPAIVKVR